MEPRRDAHTGERHFVYAVQTRRLDVPEGPVAKATSGLRIKSKNNGQPRIGWKYRSLGVLLLTSIRRVRPFMSRFSSPGSSAPSVWRVDRLYEEFYILDSKLAEFHGALPGASLPPRTPLKEMLSGRGMDFLQQRRGVSHGKIF